MGLFRLVVQILFLSANPINTPWLKVDEEAREIENKLVAGQYGDSFNLIKEPGASVRDLQELILRHKPNIVHFAGHGSPTNAIVLQDEDGRAQEVNARGLSELFGIVNANKNIKCVFLNACYSEQQAVAISKHVDCVIGMTTAVSDTAARAFAASFYQGLAFGFSIKDSYSLGHNQLALMNTPEEQSPKLHLDPSVDPAKVLLVRDKTDQGGVQTEQIPPRQCQLNLVGNWDASGYWGAGSMRLPVTEKVIFYPNNTYEESGITGGMPFYHKGFYSFDPTRSLLRVQDYDAPFPTMFFVSDITTQTFTANAPAGVLNFRKLNTT